MTVVFNRNGQTLDSVDMNEENAKELSKGLKHKYDNEIIVSLEYKFIGDVTIKETHTMD